MIHVSSYPYAIKSQDMHGIRSAVFTHEQGIDGSLDIDGVDPEAFHVLAIDNQTPIGTARIERNGKVGRVAVIKEYRKRGVGKMIMMEIEKIAIAQGIASLHLHAQKSAVKFYLNIGYCEVGDEFLEAGIPHVSMVKNVRS